VSKAETTPLTAPREWAAREEAFDRIMTYARERNLAGRQLNRDLRNGRLRSAVVQSSPDGKDTEKLLDPSDWEQWTVLVPSLRVDGWDPNVVAHLFVRRVDLDTLYPIPATATMTAAPQSDDTALSPQTTPAREKQKPGQKALKDWPNRLLAPEMVRVAYETPDLLRDRPELVRHVRKFLMDETGWEPSDNKSIHRELDRLLSRIIM
jgi:hypothetical protein